MIIGRVWRAAVVYWLRHKTPADRTRGPWLIDNMNHSVGETTGKSSVALNAYDISWRLGRECGVWNNSWDWDSSFFNWPLKCNLHWMLTTTMLPLSVRLYKQSRCHRKIYAFKDLVRTKVSPIQDEILPYCEGSGPKNWYGNPEFLTIREVVVEVLEGLYNITVRYEAKKYPWVQLALPTLFPCFRTLDSAARGVRAYSEDVSSYLKSFHYSKIGQGTVCKSERKGVGPWFLALALFSGPISKRDGVFTTHSTPNF